MAVNTAPPESTHTTVDQAAKQIEGLMARGVVDSATPAEASRPDATASDADEVQPEHSDDTPAESAEPSPDDAPPAEEDAAAPTPEPLYPVSIDGKVEHVTLKQALEGYSGRAHITRKNQELSAKEQAIEAERTKYTSALEQTVKTWETLEQLVQTPKPDWIKIQTEEGPDAFAVKYAQWNLEESQRAEIRTQKEAAQLALQEEEVAKLGRRAQSEAQMLLTAIPEWKDPAKARTEQQAIIEFGKSVGFTEQELASLDYDHRSVLLLRDAMKYRQLKAKPAGTNGTPPVQATPPVLRPGSVNGARSPVTDATKAKQSHAKLQTVDSGAAAILAAMEENARKRARGR